MFQGINSTLSGLSPQWLQPRTVRLGPAEPTPRTETPPIIAIRPELIPSTHREALISEALSAQTLFIRGTANGARRSLDDHLDNPVSIFLAA